jgi:NAD(P)-dependent dehydrogenase (short-subunit alcohol dehydrogenase family)
MARVALVTGGTRGIGGAIAKALKKAGYNVAVNYAGNDVAAKAFKKDTKIPVYKWDVGDYTACEQGIVNVENEVGPIEVLVNNAGISRDAMLQKMSHEQWSEVIRTNLDSLFNMTRPIINAMRERGFGRIINISSINGQKGQLGLTNYCAAKSGMIGFTRAQGHHRECHCSWLCRDRSALRRVGGGDEVDRRANPGGTAWRGRGGGPLRGIPRLRRGWLDHGLDADHQRRPIHGLRP